LKGGRVFLDETSPLYRAFAVDRKPLLQFDMESSPEFRDLEPADRRFFRSLQMRAYAPIVVENAFVGILACGAKNNDMPFSQYDLDLLDTMAQQTGVALRNARLLVDLNHLNRSMRSLNLGLESAKDELEKLDSVKTDFITIASHELRTPLAQIRGYSDILDALNSEGMLDQEQITTMIGNLRKATERMEELISAMLDVSQLDVNAMDLRFAQTTLESVVRYAIEPLTDVIKQRRLSFEARGLRGLPHIQADMQRLVQAFRNIIVNAVKFTPDGGDIQITASVQPANDETESAQVLVAIQDTGVGIPPENLELVFKKFFRGYDPSLHSTGAYKFMGAGPGLGLTIAKGVIEGHGGKIWAESPGHDLQQCPGSTFFVLLPLNPPENARRVLPFASETKAAS
jgi:signal transduction histidine kinase